MDSMTSGIFDFLGFLNFPLRTHGPDNTSTTLLGKRNAITMATAARAAGGLACTRGRQGRLREGRPRKTDRATPGPPGSPNPLGTSQTWYGRVGEKPGRRDPIPAPGLCLAFLQYATRNRTDDWGLRKGQDQGGPQTRFSFKRPPPARRGREARGRTAQARGKAGTHFPPSPSL